MKLGRCVLGTVMVVAAASVIQCSLLQRQSVFRPRSAEPCFTCRAEDRPLLYPLTSFLTRIKDMVLRSLNAIKDSTNLKGFLSEPNLLDKLQDVIKV